MAGKSTDPLMLPDLPKITGNALRELQQRALVLMSQDSDDPSKFPGAQPVSFERKHLMAPAPGGPQHPSLATAPYFAAEKTDGVRYMLMVLGAKGSFAIDRNFAMCKLPGMCFPSRADPSQLLDATLLDGELVQDALDAPASRKRGREGEAGAAAPAVDRMRFLVYDACRVGGKSVMELSLRLRLLAVRREVLIPRYAASSAPAEASAAAGAGAAAAHDFSAEPFSVELKDFFTLPQLPHIFSHVAGGAPGSKFLYAFSDPLRKLSHGNDGIIFTPANDPYRPYAEIAVGIAHSARFADDGAPLFPTGTRAPPS